MSNNNVRHPESERDILCMDQYRLDRLPKREKSRFERGLAVAGIPLALFVFVLFGFVWSPAFLFQVNPDSLPPLAASNYHALGLEGFVNKNSLMLAVFAASLALWLTNALPNYLTSLILIITLVLTGVLSEERAYAQLGHPIMWLNIMSFILASMLVASGLARRYTLWLITRFGTSAPKIFMTFLVLNVTLSAFISSTTAKTALLLPIFMVVAAIYGSRPGEGRNNFGRQAVLYNLLGVNITASGFMTGSGAILLSVALINGAMEENIFYTDWLFANFPVSIGLMLIAYILAMKIFFPLKPEERVPVVEGGMERMRQEYEALGPIKGSEIRAALIFVAILGMWMTDRLHGISPTAVAFVGGIVALLPRVGIVTWNDVDVPWHLMLFSAGAYCVGAGFGETGLPNILVTWFFDITGLYSEQTSFWKLYLFLTGAMTFSAMLFQSKTMRAMIFVPIAIGTAQLFNFPIISLALPVAFMIEHVYVFPFNSKPANLLFETDKYSLTEAAKFGFTIMCLAWFTNIVMGETWWRILGITPNGVFGLFG